VLPGPDLWYKLDEHLGDEKIYLVASRKPVASLAKVLMQVSTRGGAASPQLSSDWTAAIDELDASSKQAPVETRGLAGVTTGKPVSIKLSDGSNATIDLSNVGTNTSVVKKVVLKHQ